MHLIICVYKCLYLLILVSNAMDTLGVKQTCDPKDRICTSRITFQSNLLHLEEQIKISKYRVKLVTDLCVTVCIFTQYVIN